MYYKFYLVLLMFKYFNPNPIYDGKNKAWKHVDCTVRSICAATDKSWREVYKLLSDVGLKEYVMPNDMIAYIKVISSLGFKSVKKCKKGQTKVKDIANRSKKENKVFLCKVKNHVVCCKNGDILDTWDSSEQLVTQYWEKQE